MGPDEIQFIFWLLEKVVITGVTFIVIDFVHESVIDYTGTRTSPGMEPGPRPEERGCKCPSCHDNFTVESEPSPEMSFEEWEAMVLEERGSKQDLTSKDNSQNNK